MARTLKNKKGRKEPCCGGGCGCVISRFPLPVRLGIYAVLCIIAYAVVRQFI